MLTYVLDECTYLIELFPHSSNDDNYFGVHMVVIHQLNSSVVQPTSEETSVKNTFFGLRRKENNDVQILSPAYS